LGVLALAAAVPASAGAGQETCRVPRLVGLTVKAAEARARASGCRLALHGATLERAQVQTIRRQTPTRGRARAIQAWVNPLCPGSAELPGPRHEPIHTPGPPELLSGLYLDGGPLTFRSAPDCERLEGTPWAGTITVRNASGSIVAVRHVAAGHLATIPLRPGAYTITAEFDGAIVNERHAVVGPTAVEIPPHTVVRKDLALNIP
jgi:hypothetical protein